MLPVYISLPISLCCCGQSPWSDFETPFLALPKAARDRYTKKQAKLLQNVAKPIPLHEQSKDLTRPGDSAVVSMQRRQEVVRSARIARRKAIREENFLRGL